ncbi:MAG: aminodeoxychorismate/anthranilate synthase component II [Planctomycetota bacterium]|nr:aminodeoxychorismate/anthranilate synthase component II [Planctomycetota bacterium]
MILVIDNYDSFTYNTVQALGTMHDAVAVARNDRTTLEEANRLAPDYLVISPGPGRPEGAGLSNRLIAAFAGSIPVLGICLGHQCIASVFGGKVVYAPRLVHGKTSLVYHDGHGIFKGVPNPIPGGRYHSLIVEEASLPDCLEISAYTSEGEIMGIRHREFALEGVQFHPESILTGSGDLMFRNFLDLRRVTR